MHVIRLMLCDDDPAVLEELSVFLRERYGEAGLQVQAFTVPREALDAAKKSTQWDAVVIDIIMPGISGIGLAEEMRKTGFGGEILFLTSSRDYGPESYLVDALDYIVKPLDTERLTAAFDKLDKKISAKDSAFITVMVGRTPHRILLREIAYAEAGNHIMHFHLHGGQTLSLRGSLSEYMPALLANPRFVACHGSFVVNMDMVRSLDADSAVMIDGRKVPIAKRYVAFRKQYAKWVTAEKEDGN